MIETARDLTRMANFVKREKSGVAERFTTVVQPSNFYDVVCSLRRRFQCYAQSMLGDNFNDVSEPINAVFAKSNGLFSLSL